MMLLLCKQSGISSISPKPRNSSSYPNRKLERTRQQQRLQNATAQERTCTHHRSVTVAHFNQVTLTHSLFSILISEEQSITFGSPVPNTGTKLPSEHAPQQNSPFCTDRHPRPAPPSSPCDSKAVPCCHQGLQENTAPSHSSTQNNRSNGQYIPLKQITGYRRFSACNVQTVLRQSNCNEAKRAHLPDSLQHWKKKVLAKQITGKFSISCTASVCTTNGKWQAADSLAKGECWTQRIPAIGSNRHEQTFFPLKQQRQRD